MFQNLKTNWPNTHAKFEPDWFSGFLKKLGQESHGFVDLLLGYRVFNLKNFKCRRL